MHGKTGVGPRAGDWFARTDDTAAANVIPAAVTVATVAATSIRRGRRTPTIAADAAATAVRRLAIRVSASHGARAAWPAEVATH